MYITLFRPKVLRIVVSCEVEVRILDMKVLHSCITLVLILLLFLDSTVCIVSSSRSSKYVRKREFSVRNTTRDKLTMKKFYDFITGEHVIKCLKIEKAIKEGTETRFNETYDNLHGDAQRLGQKPITFIREVFALVSRPSLMESENFPLDMKEKAQALLNNFPGGSIGSYGDLSGSPLVLQEIADYITERDGTEIPANSTNIIITSGSSVGFKGFIEAYADPAHNMKKPPGIMIQIPSLTLYAGAIDEYGLYQIDMYLNESMGYNLNIDEVERAYKSAICKSTPRAIIIDNPGNPCGQVMKKKTIQEIIKFAYRKKLAILADEVYQDRVYIGKFYSFRKVMMEMGAPYNKLPLASLYTASKGFAGEAGMRGGYIEILNFDADSRLYLARILMGTRHSIMGEIALSCVVNPPKYGDPSFEIFSQEKNAIEDSISLRAKMVYDAFSKLPEVKFFPVEGGEYVFLKIILPPKAIAAARRKNIEPDFLYVNELVEETAICVRPGTVFGQIPGTYHIRLTLLIQPEPMRRLLKKFKAFHLKFLEKYK